MSEEQDTRAPDCEFASDKITCAHPLAEWRHCSMNCSGNGADCPKKKYPGTRPGSTRPGYNPGEEK